MATKGIWISVEILQDTSLTANEKFILAEIDQLSQLDKGCYASNQHFADLIGITRSNASRTITSLEKKGYIVCSIKMGTRNRERSIKMIQTCYQNDIDVVSKRQETKENKQTNKHINKQEAILIPAWISVSAWSQWVQHRKEIKKKLTPSTIKQQIKFLGKHKDSHMEIIEQSIMNGWVGLFEVDKKNIPFFQNRNTTHDAIDAHFAEKVEVIDAQLA